jgi:uncharacterized protein YqhQ
VPAGAEKQPIGGQAVHEGVMMRGDDRWSVAVRLPDGSIDVMVAPLPTMAAQWSWVPIARGVAALAESMTLGVRALTWSAARVGMAPAEHARAMRSEATRLWPTVLLAVVIVVAVFVMLPAAVAGALTSSPSAFHAVEIGMRLALFLAYLAGVGRLAIVRRLFEYHGAEHKVVGAYEAGRPLTPDAAVAFSTRHPRCGTSFMLVVMVVAAATHALFGTPGWVDLFASRLLVVPLVAGVSYEILRFTGRNLHRWWGRLAAAPGMALQGLTTREPDADQLEVAIAALEAALSTEPLVAPAVAVA